MINIIYNNEIIDTANDINEALYLKKEYELAFHTDNIEIEILGIKNPEIIYKNKEKDLLRLIEKIELLNPMTILKRGYTVTYKDDKVIKSIKEIKIDDLIKINYHDGYVEAKIEKKGK